MREKRTYRRSRCPWGAPLWLFTVLQSIPLALAHPLRGHGAVSIPLSFFRADPALPSEGLPVLLPPSTVDSLPFALSLHRRRAHGCFSRREWWGAGERVRMTVLPRIAEVVLSNDSCVRCLSLSSRCQSTAYDSLQNTVDVNSAWHCRWDTYAREGDRSRSGRRNWSPFPVFRRRHCRVIPRAERVLSALSLLPRRVGVLPRYIPHFSLFLSLSLLLTSLRLPLASLFSVLSFSRYSITVARRSRTACARTANREPTSARISRESAN